ncbi:hypothetical protein WKW79_03705 [Variovorax robiniae]|uniref:Cell envelope biogenesis protein TolA n=1 Tax=Variovorax robiniae TaxID=1836199 RepID=A0ABU8X1P3_9BURK
MKQHFFAVAIVSTLFALTGVQAMTQGEYTVAKARIGSDYRLAQSRCDTLKDNARDVCLTEAKGAADVAMAELEQHYKPSPANARKVAAVKAAAAFEVTREACDTLAGEAHQACVHQAEDNHAKAKADVDVSG